MFWLGLDCGLLILFGLIVMFGVCCLSVFALLSFDWFNFGISFIL